MNRLVTIIAAILVFTAVSAAIAQSDMIIKQRAKDLRDANNSQQAAPPATAPTPPSPAEQELKRKLDKLEADLSAIQPGIGVSTDDKQTLQKDLLALARGSVRPSQADIAKLVDDLATALSASNSSPRDQGQLARAANVIVNCSMTTPALAQSAVGIAQTTLRSSGVADADVQTVGDDLKAILADIQKKTPSLYQ
jgi:mannitol-specific phosphotransferase system IIBC component